MKRLPVTLGLACVVAFPSVAGATVIDLSFSIDPASPNITGSLAPDDVLKTGPVVYIEGSTLGLKDDFFTGDFDVLNALSYGKDPLNKELFFSVDRVAVGVPGTAVHSEAAPGSEEASGDVFFTDAENDPGTNQQFIDEQTLGLIQGFFGDDLDALELDTDRPHVYFSIDQLSSSNGFGTDHLANDIFCDFLVAMGDGGCFDRKFAEGEMHIGLAPLDDLDALVLWDIYEPGVLNPGIDKALFSLSTFSPSTFTYSGSDYSFCTAGQMSPGDICMTTFEGSYSPFVSAADLGLRDDDELNALDTVSVPEPTTLALMGLGLFGIAYQLRRKPAH